MERRTGRASSGARRLVLRTGDDVSQAESRTIRVRVVTGASNPRVEETAGGGFRVCVSASPEKGKANAQVIKALAKHLGVPKTGIELVRGHTSRDKLFRIDAH